MCKRCLYVDYIASNSKYGRYDDVKKALEDKDTLYILYGDEDLDDFYQMLGAPLMCASHSGHLDIVKLLMPKVISYDNSLEKSLVLACQNGHESIVEYLVKSGADPNFNDGETIKIASKNGYNNITYILLTNGAQSYDAREGTLH